MVDHLLDSEKVDELASFDSPALIKSLRMIRVLVSRTDVLHSLGLPSLGVKLDSIPGRLNATVIESGLGLLAGSCYELCGRGHSAIPIFILFC
jgi:cytochrome c oxidase subunit 2